MDVNTRNDTAVEALLEISHTPTTTHNNTNINPNNNNSTKPDRLYRPLGLVHILEHTQENTWKVHRFN